MQPLVRARVDMNHNNNNFKAQRNKISTLSGAVVQYVFVVNTHGIHVTIPWTLSFAALLQFKNSHDCKLINTNKFLCGSNKIKK